LREAHQLSASGYSEIQLLGQTVNSYSDSAMRFSELLLAVAEVDGIRRVRFTTSHPSDFTKDIVDAIDAQPKICEHVHLPVQSGSTRVLKSMQRSYSRQQYLEKIAMIRASRREISITTDIIVGFPGETEKDFQETLSLLDAVKYDGIYAFKYSPRPNTPAISMDDAIPDEEKGRRLAILQEKQRTIQTKRNQELVGETFEVLVHGKSRRENQWNGHTSAHHVIAFSSPKSDLLGKYVQVQATAAGPNSLSGEHVIGSH
jgi:tRNA-2-methylthio-N6-dimethylallyladenosine synthase